MTDYIIKNHTNSSEVYSFMFRNFEIFWRLWTFSIYSFFRLCGFTHFNVYETKDLSHPPPTIRIQMILINISTKLKEMKYQENDVDKYIYAQLQSMKEAEKAFSYITYTDNDLGIFINAFDQSGQYVNDILNNWKNVYPVIKPFAYGELPPISKIVS